MGEGAVELGVVVGGGIDSAFEQNVESVGVILLVEGAYAWDADV